LLLSESAWLGDKRIVMLEPRRLAARAAARRMASLIGEEPGGLVGYQTRDERRIGPSTRIEVVTEGILTRRLQNEPDLPGTGLVIFDEVHERNLPTDLGIALVLDARRTLRPDLRLLAMSATADAEGVARVLGDAPIVRSEGREYPVEVRWAPIAPAARSGGSGGKGGKGGKGGRRPSPGRAPRIDEPVADLVVRALREEPGDVLVFLPGIGEIMRIQRLLESRVSDGVDVYPLAGAISLVDQDRALAPSPPGRRRVVLATDIAETSLTVDGVRVVVDAGLARVPRHDGQSGMTRLTTVSTSRASAEQRTGRAGRTEPGVAYRLWSKLEHATRRGHLDPEITQVDLAGLALELAAWGTPVDELDWIDEPPRATLAQGRELLTMLGALDEHGHITAVGRAMLGLPVHPRLAHMVAIAHDRDRSLACVVAALVDERDIMRGGPGDDVPVDIAIRVDILAGSSSDDRVDRRGADRVRERARDIARRAGVATDFGSIDSSRSGAVLLLAYPDRLAMRRQPGQLQLRTGHSAWIPTTDPIAHETFVVAADLDGNRTNARVRIAAAIAPDDVALVLGDQIVVNRTISWDRERGDLVERTERRLDRMLIDQTVARPQPGAAATEAIVDRIRSARLAALPWSPAAASLRDRVRFLASRHPGEGWPDWSDTHLIESLDEWLVPYMAGCSTMADVAQMDLGVVLRSQLPWPLGAHVDEQAPAYLDLPTGRRMPVVYPGASNTGDAPLATVRVQHLFGISEHPRVDGVAIVLHLLSPADRPIQVTADLPGFWTGSWSEVRKEMAGRYPKHRWPVDPMKP
jgi:ATP-dependent helicase HrpB